MRTFARFCQICALALMVSVLALVATGNFIPAIRWMAFSAFALNVPALIFGVPPRKSVMAVLALCALALVTTGCGGETGNVINPNIQQARYFERQAKAQERSAEAEERVAAALERIATVVEKQAGIKTGN